MTKRPLTPTVLQGVKEGLIVKNCNAPSGRHAFGCRVRARLTARQRPGLRPPKLLIVNSAHLVLTQELFLQPTKQKRMLRSPWHPFSWKVCDEESLSPNCKGRPPSASKCFLRHSSFFHDERRPQFSQTRPRVKTENLNLDNQPVSRYNSAHSVPDLKARRLHGVGFFRRQNAHGNINSRS